MDFLGFLEEKRIFLEFLIKRKLPPFLPAARDPRIPAAAGASRGPLCGSARYWPAAADPAAAGAAGRGVARCVALDSERRAAPDPGDPSAATRACGPNCAQGFLPCSGDVGAAGSVKKDGGASGLVGGGGLGAWVAGVQGVPARASRVGG
jgi:hypothetical protein